MVRWIPYFKVMLISWVSFWGRSPWMKIPGRSYPFSASYGFYRCWPGLMRCDYETQPVKFWWKKPARWWWIFAGEMSSWNRFHTPRHRFHTCPVWKVSYLGLKVFVRKRWGFRVPPKWKLSALVSWHLIKQRRSIYFSVGPSLIYLDNLTAPGKLMDVIMDFSETGAAPGYVNTLEQWRINDIFSNEVFIASQLEFIELGNPAVFLGERLVQSCRGFQIPKGIQ